MQSQAACGGRVWRQIYLRTTSFLDLRPRSQLLLFLSSCLQLPLDNLRQTQHPLNPALLACITCVRRKPSIRCQTLFSVLPGEPAHLQPLAWILAGRRAMRAAGVRGVQQWAEWARKISKFS